MRIFTDFYYDFDYISDNLGLSVDPKRLLKQFLSEYSWAKEHRCAGLTDQAKTVNNPSIQPICVFNNGQTFVTLTQFYSLPQKNLLQGACNFLQRARKKLQGASKEITSSL